jgi:hypothetical protein
VAEVHATAGSAREKELEARNGELEARTFDLQRKLEDAERRAAGASASGCQLDQPPAAIEASGGQVHTPRPPHPHGLKLPQSAE